ncbi:MAG: hypothetical protein ACRDTH_00360, partial [Pseudonocardiaceae bacterium]
PPTKALISRQRVLGAGSLLQSHRYGDLLRVFDAVDRARELMDRDQLCLDESTDSVRGGLPDRLYCYPERDYRVSAATRRELMAKVFGIRNPDGPESDRDTKIQPMLVNLLDAINAVCDPAPLRNKPTDAHQQRVKFAAYAVQAQLSSSMEGLTMTVRSLQRQFTTATEILIELASRLQLPCRPSSTGRDPATLHDLWGPLEVLVGSRLQADGVNMFEEAYTADAWRVVFEFLAAPDRADVSDELCSPELCQAVAVLRPPAAYVRAPDSLPRIDQPQ